MTHRPHIRPTSLRVAVAVVAALAFAACGGAEETSGPVQIAAAPPPPKAAPEDKVAKAKVAFAELGKRIEKLAEDKPIDPAWMKAELEKIIALDPRHIAARFNLAALRELAGDAAGARGVYKQLAEEDPNFVPAQENIAAIAMATGDKQQAVAIYQAVIKKDPKATTARLGLARVLMNERQYDQAIDLCRKVLQRRANSLEAFRIMALSYQALGNSPMAKIVAARGLKVEKDDRELNYMNARMLLDEGDLASGVASLKDVIRIDPNWLKVRAELAAIAMKYRDFGNAAQQYEAILKQEPQSREVQVALAVAYKGLGRFEKAEEIYKGILAKDPNSVDALWNSAVLYHRHLNRYDDAVAMYQRAKTAAPPADKSVAKADELIADAIKLKSDLAAQREREEKARKKQEAIAAACEAVAAKKPPKVDDIGAEQEIHEVAWSLMGEAQAMLQGGDMVNGEKTALCALGILPDTPLTNSSVCAPLQVVWTQTLYALGRLEDARKSIDTALKCAPDNPDAQLIKQQLEEVIAQQAAAAAAGTTPEGGAPPAEGAPGADPGTAAPPGEAPVPSPQ